MIIALVEQLGMRRLTVGRTRVSANADREFGAAATPPRAEAITRRRR